MYVPVHARKTVDERSLCVHSTVSPSRLWQALCALFCFFLYTVYWGLCTVYWGLCTVYWGLCTVYWGLCTVYWACGSSTGIVQRGWHLHSLYLFCIHHYAYFHCKVEGKARGGHLPPCHTPLSADEIMYINGKPKLHPLALVTPHAVSWGVQWIANWLSDWDPCLQLWLCKLTIVWTIVSWHSHRGKLGSQSDNQLAIHCTFFLKVSHYSNLPY